jgi:hypothetical protein
LSRKLVIDRVTRVFPGTSYGGPPTQALMPTTLAVDDNDFITIPRAPRGAASRRCCA